MKIPALIIAILLFASIADAQKCNTHQRKFGKPQTWLKSNMCQDDYDAWVERRRKDRFFKDPKWWGGEAVIFTMIALDVQSTTWAQRRGIEEGNPILGRHPSNGQIIGLG